MNTNLLRVLFLEPLQLLAALLVVRALTLKLRFQAAYLGLKVRYLSFKVLKLVASKRKLMAEYHRRSVLSDQLFYSVDDAHGVGGVVMWNSEVVAKPALGAGNVKNLGEVVP